jgi:hypothetical protein
MMGIHGYKTKKDLKERGIGRAPDFIETSMFGAEYKGDGSYAVVGPDPYTARNWYATVTVSGGVIVKVT